MDTPFHSFHFNLKAAFGDYCGFQLPADYGDLASESAALYRSAAAFDLSGFGRIAISGDDASILIHNLLASDSSALDDGKWIWGLVCDSCGRLADIVRVGQTGESFLVLTSPAARHKIAELARECTGIYDCKAVKIVDQTEKTGMLGVYGPNALAAMSRIIPLSIADMEPGSIQTFSIFLMQVTVIRGSWLGLDGVEILSASAACKLAAGAIEKYHKKENIVPAGMESLEIALTEASIPMVVTSQELPERLNPLSYGFGRLLDAKKQYLGKSGPFSCGPQRQLVGIQSAGKAHTHKDLRLQYDSKEIGWTDRIVWSDKLSRTIGLAMIDTEMSDIKEEIQVVGKDVSLGAEIVDLPFDKTTAPALYK